MSATRTWKELIRRPSINAVTLTSLPAAAAMIIP
jgi:hypothetical protein